MSIEEASVPLAAIVEQMADAMVFADLNLRKGHWAGFDRAIQSGATRLGGHATVTRALHKSGKRLYVDLSFALVRGPSSTVIGATAVGRDVTARFEEEKALRQRLRELEG